MKTFPFSGKLILLSFITALVACQPKKTLEDNGMLYGLASPITLNPDTTILKLEDYITDFSLLENVELPAGLSSIRKGNDLIVTGKLEARIDKLKLISKNATYVIPLLRSDKYQIVLNYDGEANTVQVKGEFNAWNVNQGNFKKNDNEFTTNFHLASGKYQYVLVVDGKEMRDPNNPDSVENGLGGWNSLLTIQGGGKKEIPVLDTKSFTESKIKLNSSLPITNHLITWENFELENKSENQRELIFEIPEEAKQKQRSHIRAWVANESGISNEILIPLENGNVIANASQLNRKDKHAQVLYFLMVDRFNNGNKINDKPVADKSIHPKANYFGGDLAGITQKIKDGYFKTLGINTIWLSPITQNPEGAYGKYTNPNTTFSGYHGYWPISLQKIDYRFGNENEFKALLAEAHQQNMNVILDYVAHHVHQEHPLVKAKPEWFTSLYLPDGSINTERWDDQRLTTWFDVFLPTLDLSKAEVVNPMTDTAMFWVKNYDLDGFRHDASKHIDLLFWRTLTQKVKQQLKQQPDKSIFQIGETYGSRELVASYVNSGMLDGQFDFNLYDDAVATFARDDIDFSRLANSIEESLNYFGDHHLMGNVTGNQDRARFISYADGSVRFDEDAKRAGWTRNIQIKDTLAYEKLKLLSAFMLVSPGIPVIYYGDEIGMPGGNDPDNRRQMTFENLNQFEQKTIEHTKTFIQLRKNHMALLYGDFNILYQNGQQLVISRKYFDDVVVIAFNKGNTDATITIEKNQLSSSEISSVLPDKTLRLQPYSVQVFTSAK